MTHRATPWLLLAPALIVVGALFFGGLAIGLMRSLGYAPALGQTDPGLSAYRALLSDPHVWRGLGLSLWISGVSSFLSALLAIAAALLLRRTFRGRGIVGFLFQLNLTVPHLVGAIGILYLFSQSGVFARLAHAASLIERPADFPALVFDPYAIGIIAQYVWKEVPFIGVVVLARLQTLGADWEAAARSHGASPWQSFRFVLLPLIAPALVGATAIVFAFTFGAYEIPALLGASFPEALPVQAYRLHTDVDLAARPQAMALSILIAALSALMLAVYLAATRRIGR